ncbi:hypothetical protein [Spiroplasma endosymbiont of 'Nebria riversi']|uniref:hypothetical protein n=1 Tax=Spiroplasma endosymbiont of 'Nebria riversi' TaxID=2792084 RepID=UPI001C03A5F5|nr:hypothetical protein [Spiroplasma endosymbiont of 'Nebria riversi']
MKRKIMKYWVVLLLSVSQILTLAACTFRYQTKIDEGIAAKLNDFSAVTGEITKALILSREKKWDASKVINDILENKVDNLIFKNISYSYFGQTNNNNWFPRHQEFFSSQDLANKVINSNDKYVKPYANLISQNNILGKIRTYGSIFNTLTVDTLKEIFNSGSVLDPIMNFLTKSNIESFWNDYNAYIITELRNNLTEHNDNFVGKVTYAEALQWSQKRIKKIIVQIGCKKENDEEKEKAESSCKGYDSKDDAEVEAAYDTMMATFGIEVDNINDNNFSIKTNKYILENFQNGFKDLKNIISLLVPILSVISYVMKIYASLPFGDPNKIWYEVSKIPEEIQQAINDQLSAIYVGFDQSVISNLKNKLTKVFSLNDGGLSLRKLLLIIRLTPQLNELVKKININFITLLRSFDYPLIDVVSAGGVCVGFNSFLCKNIDFFPKAFPKIKEILDPIFGTVKKYLNFLPNDTNINLNDVLTAINKLVGVIQDEVLTEAKINKILAAIEIDNEHAKVALLEILGYNVQKGELIPNGVLDTLITTISSCKEDDDPNCITEVAKLLTLLTSENGILDRIINDNNGTINMKYRRFYQDSNYWRITNTKMQYNDIDNSLEVSYDISFSQGKMNNVYSIKWKTKNYYNSLASNNFKIIAFRNKEIK